jgi:hypothetical protein
VWKLLVACVVCLVCSPLRSRFDEAARKRNGRRTARHRCHYRPALEALEDRRLLTDWPIAPFNQVKPLLSAYGQYQEGSLLGIHFHEGIDILAGKGTEVRARVAGTVAGVYSDAAENNPVTDAARPWAPNDEVKVGDLLGFVAAPLDVVTPAEGRRIPRPSIRTYSVPSAIPWLT